LRSFSFVAMPPPSYEVDKPAASIRLPVAIALAGSLIYLLTTCWQANAGNLALAASLAGWDWQPMLGQPVTWLLTLPFRLLPAAWLPGAINLFFALSGAVTLGLVARSVTLFSWDCPPPPDKPWLRNLPVLLATVLCGMEFNFWVEATSGTGTMLNQLLLTAAAWCLLEFRASQNARWLNAAAVIWGSGLAQDWLMQLGLPVFILALAVLRGQRRFLNAAFLLRLALFGLAGFSVYFLPVLASGLNPDSSLGLGAAGLAALKTSKGALRLPFDCWAQSHLATVAVILFYLLPIVPSLVRLPDSGSLNQSKLDRWQHRFFRAVRAGLLLACLWLALEPAVGPQAILRRQIGVYLPLLSFAWLNALGAAFLAGNLLFVLLLPPERGTRRGWVRKINLWSRQLVPAVFAGLILCICLALAWRNAPVVWAASRQPLEKFSALAAASLPADEGILLCDSPAELFATQAALAHHPRRHWQCVCLATLAAPEYRAFLERQRQLGWLTPASRHQLSLPEQFQLLETVARARRVFCLPLPPGNLLLEQFYPTRVGAVMELRRYESEQSSGPPPTAAQLAAGEQFWDDAWTHTLSALVPARPKPPSRWSHFTQPLIRRFNRRFALEPAEDAASPLLAGLFSRLVDEWGVELQRAGQLPAAQRRFEQALLLVTDNPSAINNLECNTNLQAGKPMGLDGLEDLQAAYRDLRQLTQVIGRFGPIDQPVVCFFLGRGFQLLGLPRQALQQLERAATLAPAALQPKLALAEIYSRYRRADQVLALVKQIRDGLPGLSADEADQTRLELDVLEAKAWMAQTNPVAAQRLLRGILERHPDDRAAQNLVLGAYLDSGDVTNALQLSTRQLAAAPDDLDLLNQQAGIFMKMNQASNAIAILDRALALTNVAALRMNRALAHFQNDDLAAAEADYRQLEAEPPDVFQIHFGLAAIAQRRHDTNLAVHELAICLTNAPPGSPRWAEARAQLAALKPAAAGKADSAR
jgi:tetratricopeptide (TPR) repeat protein